MTRDDRRRAPSTGPKQRVQKVLARAGLASRRQAEALIAAGRVRVGGKRLNRQGVLVDPRRDDVSVDGRRVSAEPLTYVLLHKPREVMSTMQDPLGRRSVVEFLKGAGARVVPVGRLDYQTSGVLLLTNDGEFAREMLHPSSGVTKEYVLKVKGAVDAAGLQRLRERIDIGGKWTKPARVERMRADDSNSWLLVSLQEGKNRQVRRLAEHAGYRVMRLTRTRFAGLTAEGLRPGQWRELSASEVRTLRAHNSAQEEAGLAAPAIAPAAGRRRPNKPPTPAPKRHSGGRAPRKSGERATAALGVTRKPRSEDASREPRLQQGAAPKPRPQPGAVLKPRSQGGVPKPRWQDGTSKPHSEEATREPRPRRASSKPRSQGAGPKARPQGAVPKPGPRGARREPRQQDATLDPRAAHRGPSRPQRRKRRS